jgi:hypothetical protein
VSFAEDQHPVGDLGPGAEHESLGVCIRARAPGRDLHCGDAGTGQDRVEGFGELPGAVRLCRCSASALAGSAELSGPGGWLRR